MTDCTRLEAAHKQNRPDVDVEELPAAEARRRNVFGVRSMRETLLWHAIDFDGNRRI